MPAAQHERYCHSLDDHMKVYDITVADGRIAAFEVDNVRLGRRGLCRVVRRIPGATITRAPRFLSWFREEIFCEFTVNGQRFEADELYADNSRYWIGPAGVGIGGKALHWSPEIECVRAAFEGE